MALGRAVGALAAGALGNVLEAVVADDVAAGEQHRGVGLCGLLLADGADKDGVVDHGGREGRLKGQLILRRPLRLLLAHVRRVLDEAGQGNGAGRDGDVERRLGGEAEERAKLAGKGRRDVVKGRVNGKDVAVGRGLEVGRVDHGAAQLLDVAEVPALEAAEVLAGVEQRAGVAVARVVGEPVDGGALEEPDVLQLAQLKLEVAAAGLEPAVVVVRPPDGRREVARPQLAQNVVHFGKLLLQAAGVPAVELRREVLQARDGAVRLGAVGVGAGGVVVVLGGVGPAVHVIVAVRVDLRGGRGRLLRLGKVPGVEGVVACFAHKRRGDGELAFAEKVHGNGAVDQGGLVGHGVCFHGQITVREGLRGASVHCGCVDGGGGLGCLPCPEPCQRLFGPC